MIDTQKKKKKVYLNNKNNDVLVVKDKGDIIQRITDPSLAYQ